MVPENVLNGQEELALDRLEHVASHHKTVYVRRQLGPRASFEYSMNRVTVHSLQTNMFLPRPQEKLLY